MATVRQAIGDVGQKYHNKDIRQDDHNRCWGKHISRTSLPAVGERRCRMQLEDYFDFLGRDEIRIKDFRIGIQQVLEYYLEGFSPEQIAEDVVGLTPEEIHATITYYWHNKEEVDAYLRRVGALTEEEYEEWAKNPSPLILRLRAARAERARRQHRSA